MLEKLKKLPLKVLVIIAVLVVAVIVASIVIAVTAAADDEGRLEFALKDDNTYEVVDIKDTYRGGLFAKDTITIPSTHNGKPVTSIAKLKLHGTRNVIISEGITEIGLGAFYDSSLEVLDLPKSMTKLGDSLFSGCLSLQKVELPETLTEINSSMFRDCVNLEEIVIPSTVTTIGDNAFNGCIKLTEMSLPNSITKIGKSAFEGCINLVHLYLPSSLEEVGSNMVLGCKNLDYNEDEDGSKYLGTNPDMPNYSPYELMLEASDKMLDADGTLEFFEGTRYVMEGSLTKFASSVKKIRIPASLRYISTGDFSGMVNLEEFTVAEGNLNYSSVRGALLNADQTQFLAVPRQLKNLFIPKTVTKFTPSDLGITKTNTLPETVEFEVTEGWKMGTTQVKPENISDPAKAAEYLRGSNRASRTFERF